jgi:hypothetical protein
MLCNPHFEVPPLTYRYTTAQRGRIYAPTELGPRVCRLTYTPKVVAGRQVVLAKRKKKLLFPRFWRWREELPELRHQTHRREHYYTVKMLVNPVY